MVRVLIDDGVVEIDSRVVTDGGLLPIVSLPRFAEMFGVELTPQAPAPAPRPPVALFTSDLGGLGGDRPLDPAAFSGGLIVVGVDDGRAVVVTTDDLVPGAGGLRDSARTVSIDLPNKNEVKREASGSLPKLVSGTIGDILGPDHPIIDPDFAGLLAALYRRSETCVLDVEASGVATKIYVVKGLPAFATNGTIGDTLGRLLIRMGRITEEQLEEAVEHLIGRYQGANKRIGEVLVELGMITPHEVADALMIQTREKILSCFQWTDPRYTLARDDSFVKKIPRFDCQVPPLILEGIRRYYDVSRIERVLGSLRSRFVELAGAASDIAEKFGLGPGDRRLLEKLDGSRIAAMLHEGADGDRLAAGQFLAALISSGALEIRVGPKREAVEIEKRTEAPIPWHLRPASRTDGEGPVAPLEVEEKQAHPVRTLWAEASFKMGRRLARENPAAALDKLKKAVELRPEAIEYQMLLAYVEYRLAKAAEDRTRFAAIAKKLASEALRQDTKVASAHSILGHFAKLEGKLEPALDHYKRALALDPRDKEAKLEFRLLKGEDRLKKKKRA
jgi:hypothetical protein